MGAPSQCPAHSSGRSPLHSAPVQTSGPSARVPRGQNLPGTIHLQGQASHGCTAGLVCTMGHGPRFTCSASPRGLRSPRTATVQTPRRPWRRLGAWERPGHSLRQLPWVSMRPSSSAGSPWWLEKVTGRIWCPSPPYQGRLSLSRCGPVGNKNWNPGFLDKFVFTALGFIYVYRICSCHENLFGGFSKLKDRI